MLSLARVRYIFVTLKFDIFAYGEFDMSLKATIINAHGAFIRV